MINYIAVSKSTIQEEMMQSNRPDIQLLEPNVERDAPFALSWFERPEGHATLISMGNVESEIESPTLEGEKETLREFIELEKNGKQITRMIVVNSKTIGAVWIELFENYGVKFPSVHIIIGDPDYRGKGIGKSAMKAAIDHVKKLKFKTIYSRHLSTNAPVSKLNDSLGFKNDGQPYKDENGLLWQNIRIDT